MAQFEYDAGTLTQPSRYFKVISLTSDHDFEAAGIYPTPNFLYVNVAGNLVMRESGSDDDITFNVAAGTHLMFRPSLIRSTSDQNDVIACYTKVPEANA